MRKKLVEISQTARKLNGPWALKKLPITDRLLCYYQIALETNNAKSQEKIASIFFRESLKKGSVDIRSALIDDRFQMLSLDVKTKIIASVVGRKFYYALLARGANLGEVLADDRFSGLSWQEKQKQALKAAAALLCLAGSSRDDGLGQDNPERKLASELAKSFSLGKDELRKEQDKVEKERNAPPGEVKEEFMRLVSMGKYAKAREYAKDSGLENEARHAQEMGNVVKAARSHFLPKE